MNNTKYQLLPYDAIPIREIQKYNVSSVARSKDGFLRAYEFYGDRLPEYWINKRNSFISRVLPQFKTGFDKKQNQYRRYLSLLAWAYKPTPNTFPTEWHHNKYIHLNEKEKFILFSQKQ